MNNINAIKFLSEGTSQLILSLVKIGEPSNISLEYSFNGADWNEWYLSNLTINPGTALYIRGYNQSGFNYSNDDYYSFVIKGDKISCSGNIMSLIDYKNLPDVIPCNYCFSHLFSGCTSLTSAPELTATKLADGCYYQMFSGCTSLTSAPELPATELSEYCYSYMFKDCTSLTSAPELPARGLAYSCYHRMFSGCTSLTSAPELPTNDFIYNYYFENLMVGLF